VCAAAAIPGDKIDEVRLKADIVEVVGRRMRLVQKGRDFWGLCPFHGDKDPSLKVDRARGTWHCFGCGEGGSVFNFVMKDQGLSFPEAVKELARLYGVELPQPRLDPAARRQQEERERLLHVLQLAGTFFSRELAGPSGAPAREYLLNHRGLNLETVKAFGLGFAPPQWEGLGRFLAAQGVAEDLGVKAGLLVARDKGGGAYDRFRSRVVFPIRDLMGRAVSFGGRIIGPGEPKYLNGPESPLFHKSRTLYNLDQARPAMRQKNRVLVVEGYFDVITLAAHGFAETVAPLGTALTAEHVRALKSQAGDVVLIMDGDAAGRRAAERALPIFLAEGVSPRVVHLPAGEDPDTFVQAQGAAALAEAVERARPLMESVLDGLVAGGDLTTPEGKSAVVAAAGEIIRLLGDQMVRDNYLHALATRLDTPADVVAARLGLPLGALRPGRLARDGKARAESAPVEERAILMLALESDAAARVLCEADCFADFEHRQHRQIGEAVAGLVRQGQAVNSASLAEAIEDPVARKSLSNLMATERCPDGQDAGETAICVARRIAQRRLKRHLDALNRAIAAAQGRGDQAEVGRLMAERVKLRKNLTSPSSTGKD